MIQENLAEVNRRIAAACQRSGRPTGDVTLIAVSKTKPVDMIQAAYDAGARDFGENKAQELAEKYEQLPKDIRWHMIGHLQTNKVKYIVDKVCLIHSVDSLRLAKEISTQAEKKSVDRVDILIEVNIAGEDTKYGVTPEEAPDLAAEIAALPRISIRGLMAIAPYVEDGEENREHFQKLKKLAVDILDKKIDNINMEIFSMGMTGDYETAVEEGATMVRVGTGIFGERNYNKE